MEGLQEAQALLAAGKLPPNHKAVQAIARSGKKNDGTKTRAEFLQEYFEAEIRDVVKELVYTESIVESTSNLGEQVSFDRMVELEGGRHNPANIRAAHHRAKMCMKRGPKYYIKDEWSGRVNFFFVRGQFEDKKKRQWDSATKATVATPAKAVGAAAGAATGTPVPKPAGEPPNPPRPPRKKTKLENALATATKRKVDFKQVHGQAKDLLASMESDPAYGKGKKLW